MHDRLTNRGQAIADEIEAIWNKADEEYRGLSRRERARVETLLEKAESFRDGGHLDGELELSSSPHEIEGGAPVSNPPACRPHRNEGS